MKMKRYKLTATNIYGAQLYKYDQTLKAVLNQFDNEYKRKGWKIDIYDLENPTKLYVVKSTFR